RGGYRRIRGAAAPCGERRSERQADLRLQDDRRRFPARDRRRGVPAGHARRARAGGGVPCTQDGIRRDIRRRAGAQLRVRRRGRDACGVCGVVGAAALAAIARLHESGLIERHAGTEAAEALANAGTFARMWQRRAPGYFLTELPADAARDEVRRYAERIGVKAARALAALGDGPVRFHAVALDANGEPVPVLNTDEAFALFFLDPPPDAVEGSVTALLRPFPAGLMTDVGPVVANPVYADDALEPGFGRSRYHGTVIWSCQQAVLAA